MTAESLDLWLVLREGRTSSEVAYVALGENEARAFCEQFDPDADGYHDWTIRHVRAGCHLDLSPKSYGGSTQPRPDADTYRRRKFGPAKIEHADCQPLHAIGGQA